MHQVLIQWDGDQIEVVQADGSANVAAAESSICEAEEIKCLSGMTPTHCDFLRVSERGLMPEFHGKGHVQPDCEIGFNEYQGFPWKAQ